MKHESIIGNQDFCLSLADVDAAIRDTTITIEALSCGRGNPNFDRPELERSVLQLQFLQDQENLPLTIAKEIFDLINALESERKSPVEICTALIEEGLDITAIEPLLRQCEWGTRLVTELNIHRATTGVFHQNLDAFRRTHSRSE